MQRDRKSELLSSIDPKRISMNPEDIEMQGENDNFADLIARTANDGSRDTQNYDTDNSVEIYRNFLNWLFATFRTSESAFREEWLSHLALSRGERVLVTSCGLGEDLVFCQKMVGEEAGFVHGQDLSRRFIEHAGGTLSAPNVVLTVSDALNLPYKDGYFDAVCHFGGINLFGDMPRAISEMNRVCKIGGRVLFGDEAVSPHLRDHDYGKMFIKNNPLWGEHPPMAHLPIEARNVFCRYVLGNCFYLIGFTKGSGLPDVDIDVRHEGYRGGSVRTRYFGQVEGVRPELRDKLYEEARKTGHSASSILEKLIEKL